jgi:peptidoglycan hydrolase-like protein with peptidoglycan-binding domain
MSWLTTIEDKVEDMLGSEHHEDITPTEQPKGTFTDRGERPPVGGEARSPERSASDRAYGDDEAGWIVEARRYNRTHPAYVQQFDAATESACRVGGELDPKLVADWQRERGLEPDGKVGPATLRAVNAKAAGGESERGGGGPSRTNGESREGERGYAASPWERAADQARAWFSVDEGVGYDPTPTLDADEPVSVDRSQDAPSVMVPIEHAQTDPSVAEPGELIDGWLVYPTFARKIAHGIGTLAWRNNNPGNLTVATPNDGGMYGDYTRTTGMYRVFPTYERGRAAIGEYIKGWGAKGKTLHGLAFLPYGDAGFEQRYLDLWVKATGATPQTRLSDLSDEQIEAMTAAIVEQEGARPGIEAPRSDAPGPDKPARVFLGKRIPWG